MFGIIDSIILLNISRFEEMHAIYTGVKALLLLFSSIACAILARTTIATTKQEITSHLHLFQLNPITNTIMRCW
jgi:hypothetical protein